MRIASNTSKIERINDRNHTVRDKEGMMRNINRSLILLALIIALASPSVGGAADLNLSSLVGSWENVNPQTQGITKIVITDNKGIAIRAFGACKPQSCDWGVVSGSAYGRNETSTRAIAFLATFNNGVTESLITGSSRAGESMRVEVFTKFVDGSGRFDYTFTDVFVRK